MIKLEVFHKLKPYYFVTALVVIASVVHFAKLDDLLDYDRGQINKGEWWLLISGHFTHLGFTHYILNIIALLIIWELFFRQYSLVRSVVEFLFLCCFVGVGIYYFSPDVEWYVGLSGVLHGLFAIGILNEILLGHKLSLLVGIGLVAKILWEQFVGITTGAIFEADSVLVDAHLYGAIGGCFVVLVNRAKILINSIIK